MTLKEARALRDYIHSKNSINCTVPLGHGPDGYFPRSDMGAAGPRDWKSKQEFRDWHAQYLRRQRKIMREYHAMLARQSMRRARSPIELMVDRACGLI
jgi:hypothetical protein